MKKYILTVFFLVSLYVSPLFAVGGEIIISNGGIKGLRVIIRTEIHAWKWDDINKKVIPENMPYSRTYDDSTAVFYRFDAPNSMNDGLPCFPWGLMTITIITTNPASTKTFILDTRDEDWAENALKYPSHDTYISKNTEGAWQISTDYHTYIIGDGSSFSI